MPSVAQSPLTAPGQQTRIRSGLELLIEADAGTAEAKSAVMLVIDWAEIPTIGMAAASVEARIRVSGRIVMAPSRSVMEMVQQGCFRKARARYPAEPAPQSPDS